MNKKMRTLVIVTTVLYILFFIVPTILSLIPGPGDAFTAVYGNIVVGWIAFLTIVGAPFVYFWLYRQTKVKPLLVSAILSGIVLIILVVMAIVTIQAIAGI